MENKSLAKQAWAVLLAGLGVNLTIGVLYSWSVIKKSLVADLNWSNSEASLPYTVAILVWALTLLVAGKLQDKYGPKKIVILGTIFTALGLILSSFTTNPAIIVLSYGIITGGGIGFAYASVTPPALKWFHPAKKGMVTGIVVSGMGLASLYIAPITTALISSFGISRTFLILGIFILIVGTGIAQLIKNPPEGYVPEEPKNMKNSNAPKSKPVADFDWKGIIKTKEFYFLWIMFALSSSAGLMIIGNLAAISLEQASWDKGFFLVGLLAIFNALGRIGAGLLSDKIGRIRTLTLVLAIQGINMLLFASYVNPIGITIGTMLAGIGYGSLLSLFPSLTADFYGVKNFGGNYGVLYTAWGISGTIGPIMAAVIVDSTGSYNLAYLISAGLLIFAIGISLITKNPQDSKRINQAA